MDIFEWFVSLAVTLPLLSLIAIYFLLRYIAGNKKKTILWTADITTIIFITSVHFHLIAIFEKSFILHIVLVLVGLIVLFYYVDYKKTKMPSIVTASKKVWRLSFLVFFVSYLFLTLYGVVDGIIQNTLPL
ncbi:ABC-type iron transport system FetAB permease component [Metabacillus crassostreae]|uniref:DUF3397 domain-containing protein n=1 Tax=Metabacillus crassostreae TaxID=929098 RepID=UPI00195AAAF4|nr:DUF3397 domain-containing protein [Metabacillus crassostreae]MBM7603435.1 ABC-type iron transport system FetAB permease component [Metabacillus crassostreae]